MAAKLDLKQAYPDYYKAAKVPAEAKFGPVHHLTFDGHGAPGEASFDNAVGAVYAIGYAVKQAAKERDAEFVVPPPEALFWTHDGAGQMKPKDQWTWRILMRMPPGTTKAHVEHAKDKVGKKRGDLDVQNVRYEKLHEGRCVQALHVGPYDAVQEAINGLFAYMHEHGLRADGAYHEIYLSDPRRAKPENLKTIVRMPVA